MSRFIRVMAVVLLAVLMLPVLSMAVSAEDYYARLEMLHFDIVLWEDGSAEITETRQVSFTGDHTFTRYGVSNAFAGPRVFSDWQVSMDGEPLIMLDAPDNDNRPEDTFAVEDGYGENTVYIYHSSRETTRTFQIYYRLENAVKRYSDVGEFFWNLTGESGISSIDLVSATLTVPEGVPEEEFRIWAHGPLNGTFEKLDAVSAYLQVSDVPYGTIVDLRTTIPADFFTGGWEQEGEVLAEILAEEKRLADSANAQRQEQQRQEEEWKAEQEAYWAAREAWELEHPVLTAIESFCTNIIWTMEYFFYCIEEIFFLLLAAVVVAVNFAARFICKLLPAYKNIRHKPEQAPQYYRKLPDNRPAPCADRLLQIYNRGGANVSRYISSAMLELNLKQKIRFHSRNRDTEILLNHRFPQASPQITQKPSDPVLRMTWNGEPSGEGFDSRGKASETYLDILLDFLQGAAGTSGRITISELKAYVQQNAETARNFRNAFENAERSEFEKWVRTEQTGKLRIRDNKLLWMIPGAVAILMTLLTIGGSLYDGVYWPGCLTVSLGSAAVAAVLGFSIHFGRNAALGGRIFLDQKSENDLALWAAFGRFLDDFTTFDRKELPEFPVWREYMVYAVAMGKGKKVAKALSVKYPDAIPSENDEWDDEYYRMMRDMALYEALDSIGEKVAAAVPPRQTSGSDNDSWSDNWSDSDGGGGGFSDSDGGSDSGSRGDFAD